MIGNRRCLIMAVYYPLVLLTVQVGYVLAPTYLQGVRSYSTGVIGLLLSILSVGSLAFNYVVGKARPQVSFIVLIGAVRAGTLLLWQTNNAILMGAAFALLGGLSAMWLVAQTTFGRLVNPQQRGLAYGATAVASWLAGQLYEGSSTHDLPLIVGLVGNLAALIVWLSLGHHVQRDEIEMTQPQAARQS